MKPWEKYPSSDKTPAKKYSGIKLRDIPSPEQAALESTIGGLEAITNAIDIPRSIVASSLSKGIEGDFYGAMKAPFEQIAKMRERGMEAVSSAPTGKDIAGQLGLSKEETLGPEGFKFSPAGAAGIAVDVVTDPLTYIPVSKLAKPIQVGLENFGSKQAARSLSRYITNSKYLKEGFNPKVLGKQIFNEDLVKYLDKPTKLLNVLGGEPTIEAIEEGGKVAYKQGATGKGLIGNVSNELDDFLVQVERSSPDRMSTPSKFIEDSVNYRLKQPIVNVLGGEGLDTRKIAEIESLVESHLKKPTYSISELRKLKKNIGQTLKSKVFFAGFDDAVALNNEVKETIVRTLDDIIEDKLDGAPAKIGSSDIADSSKWYQLQNSRLSSLIKTKELVESSGLTSLKKDDILAIMSKASSMVVGGGLLGTVVDAPLKGAMIGGMYHGIRTVGDMAAGKAPSALSSGAKVLEKNTPGIIKSAPEVQRLMTPRDEGRSPQSISKPILAQLPELASEIIDARIPRSTDEVFKNRKLFMAKVAQQAPQYFDIMQEAMKEGPEAISDIMLNPQIQNELGTLFERDRYGSWDGMIIDPGKQNMYRKDIWAREDLDTLEKSEIIDQFNRTQRMPL